MPANDNPYSDVHVGQEWNGIFVKEINYVSPRPNAFIVFLDRDWSIQWFRERPCSEMNKEQHGALRYAAMLDAIPISELDKERKLCSRRMIAQGVIAALEDDSANSHVLLRSAEDYLLRRRLEVGRLQYFYAALVAFVVAGIGGIISAYINGAGGKVVDFVAGSAMGAVGAFTFAIWRWKERELDPDAGWKMQAADGVIRIMMGALAGLLVMMLIHSRLDLVVMSFQDMEQKSSLYAAFVFCFVSGWSERWVPNLVASLEKNERPNPDTPSAG